MLTEQETSSLCFDLRETHIDRAKLFDRAESLRRREKQNQASLVYYSIVSSPLIKRESKLCYFPKMLEHKQLKNMAFTGSNSYWCLSKSVENNLDEQTVVFIVALNQDKYNTESSQIL